MKAFLILGLIMSVMFVSAQTKKKDTIQLKKVMELNIKGSKGANGAGIAWNPVLKKYYCAVAGNAEFPMSVFDEGGKLLSDTTLQTMIDVRGIWYNPNTSTLQANGYNETGWVSYNLDRKGIPVSITTLFEGMNQPDVNSVGMYDARNNSLYFYDTFKSPAIAKYSMTDAKPLDLVYLHPATKIKDKITEEWDIEAMNDYNGSTVVYTGIPGYEFGMLNFIKNQVELYNNEGLLTKVLQLPMDSPANEIFNYSYCNGIYWFFDKINRKWIGYK